MQTLSRGLYSCILAVALASAIAMAAAREVNAGDRPDSLRYRAYLPNYLLPLFVGILVLMPLILRPVQELRWELLSLCFSVFLHICVYYLLLCFVMPLLRKGISSRVCAALWLLPNYLYLMWNSLLMLRVPKWAVYVPTNLQQTICLVWLAGFAAVLGWKCLSHFRFRYNVLKNAEYVQDPGVLALWQEELRRAGVKADYWLVRSPAVSTPLTIGFFGITIRVVLPERDYTPEELRLIFRHEIVHIGREDSGTKFFLAFCTAMCWFNPLMWLAVRRSADDLELSCDETVLLGAEESTRRQYAELLLTTAGDERGFTTCLSASAKALRYRLRYVMKPRKRIVGSVVAGAMFFALIMTCGHVTLAYDRMSGAEYIFGGGELARYEVVEDVYWKEPGGQYVCRVVDTAELNGYLAGLTIYEITDQYDFSDTERYMDLDYQGPDGETRLHLTDHVLGISRPGDRSWHRYFIQEDIDWEHLYSQLSISPTA